MKTIITWTAAFVTLATLAALAFAGVPQTISYQGFLKDSTTGAPVSAKTEMTFSLYSTANGAGAVWRGASILRPVNGVYSVELGASPLPALPAFDRAYWLGLQAGTDPEMRPLQPLTSVPYALRAVVADSVPDGSITAAKLATGAVTDSKITGPISGSKIPDLATLQATAATQQTTINQQQALIQTLQIQMSHINSPPVVSAGYDFQTSPGTAVMLYGKLSDSSPYPYQGLTWAWSIAAKPAGSSAAIENSGNLVAVFTPDVAGDYSLSLTVSDGASTVTRSAALSVTAGMLGRAQLIETDDTADAHYPHVATDAAGNAIAVWERYDGSRVFIWTNRYTPAEGWEKPERIDVSNDQVTNLPHVAMDQSGNAVAVWGQLDGTTNSTWANSYAPTTGWGTAQVIGTGYAADHRVAMDASGNAMVVWYQNDGTSTNIWANSSSPAGVWGTAQLIETSTTESAAYPQVAMGPAGVALAVWRQCGSTTVCSVWANRYTPASGWGTAHLIETDNSGHALDPQVAMDTSGNAVAVWEQSVAYRNNIWANRCSPAGVWGTAQLLETAEVGTNPEPQVAMSAAGNAVVVWNQIDGSFHTIWGTQYTTAGGWGTAQRIQTGTTSALFQQVAMDSSGNAIAVWHQYNSPNSSTWANRYSPAGGWSGAKLIESFNTGDVDRPQIAMSASGYAMAVWHVTAGGRDDVWANTISVGWRQAQLIETDNSGAASNPQLEMNSTSNAVAVWQQSDGTRTNIWANRYTPVGGWNTPQLIETDNTSNAQKPQVAIDSSGNAVAAWQQYDGTRYNIRANRSTAAGGWGTAQLIETDNTGSAQNPQVATDGAGNAVVVWQQYDAAGDKIWVNRYSQTTGLWGTPVLIETVAAGSSYFPQIAMNSAGTAVVVWQRYDGVRDNIWANRFTLATGLWGTAQLIEVDNAGHASNPQVAIDTSGNAVAVWYQNDGIRDNIRANRSTAAGVWGSASLIEADNGTAVNPQVAIDSGGNAVAVWQQHDGSRYNILANRCTPAGAWGSATLIESDSGAAVNPQVTVDSAGIATAVWQQSDGSRDSIRTNNYTPGSGWGVPLSIDGQPGASANARVATGATGKPIVVWQKSDGTRTNIWSSRPW